MLHADARFVEAITSTVAEIEQGTTAELVVVASARSAPYTGAAVLAGAACAWLAVGLSILAGRVPSVHWLLVELPLLGGLIGWWISRTPSVLGLLLSSARKEAAVQQAAAAAFTEELVHGTRARTGLLVYVSSLEKKVCLLPDGGIEAVVPPAEWEVLPWCRGPVGDAPDQLDELLAGMREVGVCLARHLPADDSDNPDELPNAPRVRP